MSWTSFQIIFTSAYVVVQCGYRMSELWSLENGQTDRVCEQIIHAFVVLFFCRKSRLCIHWKRNKLYRCTSNFGIWIARFHCGYSSIQQSQIVTIRVSIVYFHKNRFAIRIVQFAAITELHWAWNENTISRFFDEFTIIRQFFRNFMTSNSCPAIHRETDVLGSIHILF